MLETVAGLARVDPRASTVAERFGLEPCVSVATRRRQLTGVGPDNVTVVLDEVWFGRRITDSPPNVVLGEAELLVQDEADVPRARAAIHSLLARLGLDASRPPPSKVLSCLEATNRAMWEAAQSRL